ncbi:MAG: pyrimidine dimer DNA glycosylase/endonuclease V [Candidatus Diapherotrites archaeon]
MRIWDIPPSRLCRVHLLGEHRELHAIWSIYVNKKKGYLHHPETKRWAGKLRALFKRHDALVVEMEKRGCAHKSPLEKRHAKGLAFQDELIDSLAEQKRRLRGKPCACFSKKE